MKDGTGRKRNFAEVLAELRFGQTLTMLSEALVEATEAAKRTGKMASLTLTVKIKPQGERQVEVVDEIKKKIPQPNMQPTIMFIDECHNLTRNDMRQMRIDELKTVSDGDQAKGELILINQKTGELREVNA